MPKKQMSNANFEASQKSYAYQNKTNPGTVIVVVPKDGCAYEPRQSIRMGGVDYELTDKVKIDVNLIPDHIRERLAKATLELVRNFLKQPGGRERLDQKIAELKADNKL